MRKQLIAKGNLHKRDKMRALVTETQPGDIPVVISNDGFYKNMKMLAPNPAQRELVQKILDPVTPFTIPYRYNIIHPSGSPRRLSLIHPASQLQIVDLYSDYAELICYYCRKSEASIRSPRKIASTFFVRGAYSERNALKGGGIDTVELDETVSNPASYFSYSGVSRAFKFFGSNDYIRLEKRFAVMYFADISKCFSSIYTHTLFWAIADTATAKTNIKAKTFSNRFDKIMQASNYNETNGICIGSEASRIFAELILSEVDRKIVETLASKGLRFRVEYEYCRYVDDFFIFAKDEATAQTVLAAVKVALSEFNLHLNDQKTHPVPRPFITIKSRMIRDANRSLEEFFSKFIGSASQGPHSYAFPKRVRRPSSLLKLLLESIKSSCFDHKSGYDLTSNYVISSLALRIVALVDGYAAAQANAAVEVNDDDYVSSIMLLLEAVYFFYNVNPTVPSSLRVAQAAIIAANFFEAHIPDRRPFLAEQIVRWTHQFVKELAGTTKHQDNECVALEAINVLVVLGEVGRGEVLAQEAIGEFCRDVARLGYFEIVSFLFCFKDDPAHDDLRDALFARVKFLVSGKGRVRSEAQAAHLALDILACPYITVAHRAALFNSLRTDCDLPALPLVDAVAAVEEFEKTPWFVNWREANLLNMIRKKELAAVY